MNATATTYLAVGVAVVAVTLLVSRRAKAALDAITPTNNDNVFARAVNAVGDVLDDGDGSNDGFSLGGWIYDLTHDEFDPNAPDNGVIDNGSGGT